MMDAGFSAYPEIEGGSPEDVAFQRSLLPNGQFPSLSSDRYPISRLGPSPLNSETGKRAMFGHPPLCAGCGAKIADRFLLYSPHKYWHENCLKCSCCGVLLAHIGTSYFERAGMLLCRPDYMRIFATGRECGGCGQIIPPKEYVMRSGVGQAYHLKCFMCSWCDLPLEPGDRYKVVNNSLMCARHFMKMAQTVGKNSDKYNKKGRVGRPKKTRE